MRPLATLLLAGLAFAATAGSRPLNAQTTMNRVTPILVVDRIEPCLAFWTDRLGFEVTGTVPHGDATGFAMLQKGGVELMYQSRASVHDDVPALTPIVAGQTATLFIQVDALDPIVAALEGVEVLVPRRQTFYGMDEIFVRADCGTVVGFAALIEEPDEGPGDS